MRSGAQVSSVGVCWYENRRGSRACPPWWVERPGGDAVSESPPSTRSRFRFPSRSAIPPLRFRGGTPSCGSRGFASASSAPKGRHPSSASSAPKGRHPSSASSAPKGRHPSAQGSALGTGHTPDSQPRRGAIAGRAVPMDCRYAAPAGLNLVLDSFPGRCPGLRNGRAFSAPRPLAFATRPAGSLPQESGDPFCSPEAETIETEAPTELTCAPQGGRAVSKLAAWLPVRA